MSLKVTLAYDGARLQPQPLVFIYNLLITPVSDLDGSGHHINLRFLENIELLYASV